ncbi:putative reverse transcriptase domain-containing protein [Tanacetum coccineum]
MRPETVRTYAAAPVGGKIYAGNLPKCNWYNLHHHGTCPQKCQRCQRIGHMEKDCRVRIQGAGNVLPAEVNIVSVGEKGHFKGKVLKAVDNPTEWMELVGELSAEKSFVSSAFTHFIDIAPATLNTSYEIELADGKSCLPHMREVEFRIDLIPGASPVVRSPYWLAPSEMLELSNHLKELQEKGFISTSHSLGEHSALCQKQDAFDEKNCVLTTGKTKQVVFALNNLEHYHYGTRCLSTLTTESPSTYLNQERFKICGLTGWIELLSDYECEIKYHPGKANVVADALSRKERLKPRRVRAMSITIHSGLKTKILEAQSEASKDLKAPTEWLRGLERHFEQ